MLSSQGETPLQQEQCDKNSRKQRTPRIIYHWYFIHGIGVKSLSSERAQRQTDADVLSEKDMKVSIVVPVLDENAGIRKFLENVRQCAASAEVIVVEAEDSQSISKSLGGLCDRVLT